jgi:O-antigen/teichoic acid export membrane protein
MAPPEGGPDVPPALVANGHEQRSGSRRLAQNLLMLSGGQVVTWLITLVWTLVVPRALGPVGLGLLVLYLSTGGVMTTIAGMGTKTLLVREIAADSSSGPRLIGASLYMRTFMIGPVLLVTLAYIVAGSFHGEEAVVVILAFVATVVNLYTDPFQAAFQAIERMEYLAVGDVLVKTVGTVGAIALVLIGYHALAIVILTLLIGWMLLMSYGVLIRRYVRVDLHFDWSMITRLFRDSLTFWAFTMSMTIYLWVDSILLAMLAPADQLGFYGAPTRLVATLMFVPTIVWTVWLPRLSSAHRWSPASLKSAAQTPLDIVILLGAPVAVGALLVAKPLIHFLYGGGFGPSAAVFTVLALTIVPVYVNTAVGYILIASRRQLTWTVVMACAGVINAVANLILIRQFQERSQNGALGAAAALVITEVAIMVAGLVLIRGVISRHTLVRFAKTLAATGGMAACVAAVHGLGLLLQVATGMVTFTAFALLLRVATEPERQEASALLSRMARGWGLLARFQRWRAPVGRLG